MIWRKIKYKIGNLYRKFTGFTDRLSIDWYSVFNKFILLLIILSLGYNVYNSYNKVMDSLERYETEKETLAILEAENQRLLKERKYYQSQEFKKIYARDNLNLVEPGEEIYLIDGEEVVLDIEKLPEEQVQITLEDNWFWWRKLLFGS